MLYKLAFPLIALLILITPTVIHGQFTESRPYKTEAGPYILNIQEDPSHLSLGTVDYTIIVSNVLDHSAVSDARVLIWGTHATNGHRGWANALNNPLTPAKYTARVQLEGPGVWEMSIDVMSPLGRVAIQVPSQTIPRPRLSQSGSLVFIGVFVVLIGATVYATFSIRRSMKARENINAS